MWSRSRTSRGATAADCAAVTLSVFLSCLAARPAAAVSPIQVVASTPDLGALVRVVGGERVSVSVLAKPSEDPHFVEARPSYVKALNSADLLVVNGLDLEMGYVPVLIDGARNPRIQPGSVGYVDASAVISPLNVPSVPIDRSMGDVHPWGNPHYLVDPLMGLKVAALIRDVLSATRPAEASYFAARYDDFKARLDDALVGPVLARKYGAEKLATLAEYGKLTPFLEKQGELEQLGGWLGQLAPYYGTKAVDDHPMWPYFARRFGLQIAGDLEPKPGVPPTTKHLREVVEMMQAREVPLILAAAYYDPRHADLVARETGARVVRMANQVGARPGTDGYLDMVNYNVTSVVEALRASD